MGESTVSGPQRGAAISERFTQHPLPAAQPAGRQVAAGPAPGRESVVSEGELTSQPRPKSGGPTRPEHSSHADCIE